MPKKKGMSEAERLLALKEKRRQEALGVPWMLLCYIVVVGAISQFVSIGLPTWIVANPITYSYMNSHDKPTSVTIRETNYGLYMVSYNGGVVTKPWFRLQNQICTQVDAMTPIMGTLGLIYDANCPQACIDHFRTRCQNYKVLKFAGYLVMGCILLSACASLLGVGWLSFMGKSPTFLEFVWIVPPLGVGASVGFFWMQQSNSFHALRTGAQFPQTGLGTAFYLGAFGTAAILLAGLAVLGIAAWEDRKAWQERQREIDEQIIAEGMSHPGGPMGGMMPPITGPAGFRPPGGGPMMPSPPGAFGMPPPMPGRGPPMPLPPGVGPGGMPPPRPGMPPPPGMGGGFMPRPQFGGR